jgi:hypothetical protein
MWYTVGHPDFVRKLEEERFHDMVREAEEDRLARRCRGSRSPRNQWNWRNALSVLFGGLMHPTPADQAME